MKILLLGICTLCIGIGTSIAADEHVRLTATIDSTYFDFASSNRSLFRMADDVLNADNVIFHKIDAWAHNKYGDSTKAKRRSFALGLFTSAYMQLNLEFTLHEFGHWNRDKIIGLDYGFNGRSDVAPVFFLQNMFDPGSYFESDWENGKDSFTFFPHPDSFPFLLSTGSEEDLVGSDWDMLTLAGGFTHDAKLATLYADRLYNGTAIPTNVFGYIWAKIFPYIYAKSSNEDDDDPELLVDNYRLRGWNIDKGDIGNAALNSLLLSASTYSYFKGVYEYFSDGKTLPAGFEYKGFRLPDVEAYFDRGIAYKMLSGYRINDRIQIPFAIERVVKGDKRTEYTIGMNMQITPALSTKSNFIYGEKLQGSIELSYQHNKHFNSYLGAEYNDLRNLEGMRNILDLKNGITDHRVYAGFVVRY